MQYTALADSDATCWTWYGGYLFRREFALLQANRILLQPGASLCNFERSHASHREPRAFRKDG
jgi:hypothetical protein